MTSAAPSKTLLGNSTNPLRFRVCGLPNAPTISIQSPKITIGSSRHCTVRLKSPHIAPVQCLILRGEHQTVVRRWTANTRLNDHVFDEAPLCPGDRLSIGPVQLEVLDPAADSPATPAVTGLQNETTQQNCNSADLEANLAQLHDEQLRQLEQKQAELERRSETLAADRKAWQAEQQAWHDQRSQLESAGKQREAELAQRESALRHSEAALRQSEAALEQQLADFKQQQLQLQQQSAAVDAQVLNFSQRNQEIEQSAAAQNENQKTTLAAQEAKLAALQQQIKTDRAQFDANQKEFQSKQDAWQRDCAAYKTERAAWEAEKAAWEANHTQRANELQSQQAGFAETQQALANEQAALKRQQQEFQNTHGQHLEQQQAFDAQQASLTDRQQQLAALQKSLDDRVQSLNKQEQAIQSQQQSLQEQSRAVPKQQQAVEQQLLVLQQEEETLNQRTKSLDEREQLLGAQQQSMDRQQQTLAERQQTLDRQQQSLEETQKAVEQKQKTLQADRTRQESALADHAATLEQQIVELESQCQQLSQDREQACQQRQELQQQLETLSKQKSTESATNISDSTKSETVAGDAVESPAGEDEQETTDADENALFARLRAMSVLKEPQPETAADSDESEPTDSAVPYNTTPYDAAPDNIVLDDTTPDNTALDAVTTEPEQPVIQAERRGQDVKQRADESDNQANESSQRPAAASAPVEQRHGDDDTIDDYMAKLLQRMRGIPIDDPAPATKPMPVANESTAATPSISAASSSAPNHTATAAPADSVEKLMQPPTFEPRTTAPEKIHELAAMREIAIQSSRAAIATHHHKHGTNQAWTTLAVGGINMVLGLVLLCMTQAVFSLITLCGLIGLGAGGYFIYESRALLRNLQLSKHHKQVQLEEIAREQNMTKPHENIHAAAKPGQQNEPVQTKAKQTS